MNPNDNYLPARSGSLINRGDIHFPDVVNGIPHSKQSDADYDEKYEDKISCLHVNRVGADHKRAAGRSQPDETKDLLQLADDAF